MSELTVLESEEAAEAEPAPTGLALIRNRVSEMQTGTALLLANTWLPEEIRHYLNTLMDVLSDTAYACREREPQPDGAGHPVSADRAGGADDDLPGSWRAW